MIIVRNTKELEKKYNLNEIPNDEKIMVLGGMEGKEKYNLPRYQKRLTYTGRQIKQIIAQMREIESTIPESWNEWQRAKYIYKVLGNKISYCHDYEFKGDAPSNLTVLLNREGICAGYSLLYKEMMDRQGIECEYVRGHAMNEYGQSREKHAWNVLVIKGKQPVQVDLTWDSDRMQNGEESFRFFGNDDFELEHKADDDERVFKKYKYLSLKKIDSIDIQGIKPYNVKLSSITNAIDQTYRKYSYVYGKEKIREIIKRGIGNYIDKGDLLDFTRDGDGRNGIKRNVSQADMLDEIINFYVKEFIQPQYKINNLEFAVSQTLSKYDEEQTEFAIKSYITNQDSSAFTRMNNARDYIKQMTPQAIRELVIEKIIDSRVQLIEENLGKENSEVRKNSFSADELAQASLPEENRAEIIKSAMGFIKSRNLEKNRNARSISNTREENVNSVEYEEEK